VSAKVEDKGPAEPVTRGTADSILTFDIRDAKGGAWRPTDTDLWGLGRDRNLGPFRAQRTRTPYTGVKSTFLGHKSVQSLGSSQSGEAADSCFPRSSNREAQSTCYRFRHSVLCESILRYFEHPRLCRAQGATFMAASLPRRHSNEARCNNGTR